MKTGKLTIFTSYSPGAGKTYLMVSRAMEEKRRGKTVCFGFLNGSHRDMQKLLDENGFKEQRRRKYSSHKLIAERPKMIVMDEMGMHGINTDNEKTFVYQDIEQILAEGIDVYATANLKRFHCVNPLFKQVTGIGIKKTIPSRFLDMADKIYFIDRKPELLMQDFESGNLFNDKYMNSKIMKKNFEADTLTAYREISLKFLKKYEKKVEVVIR